MYQSRHDRGWGRQLLVRPRGWAALTCLVCLLGVPATRAAEDGRPAAGADVIQEPTAAMPAPAQTPEDLQIRYAMMRLRLAELNLERAVRANENTKGAIGDREIQRLQNYVTVMEKRLEIVRAQPRTAARQVTIAAAEADCINARGDLDTALLAQQHHERAVSDLNIERLRLKVHLAETRLELCRNPEYELSLLDEMQWSIDQLTDEVIDLRHQVDAVGHGR